MADPTLLDALRRHRLVDGFRQCALCNQPWPCDASRALVALEAAEQWAEALEIRIESWRELRADETARADAAEAQVAALTDTLAEVRDCISDGDAQSAVQVAETVLANLADFAKARTQAALARDQRIAAAAVAAAYECPTLEAAVLKVWPHLPFGVNFGLKVAQLRRALLDSPQDSPEKVTKP